MGQLGKSHSYIQQLETRVLLRQHKILIYGAPKESHHTFRQHLVHSDLLSPNAKDPSDVAAAQARGAAPSSAGAGAQARATLLSPGVEKLLHHAKRKQESKIPTVSGFFFFFLNKISMEISSRISARRGATRIRPWGWGLREDAYRNMRVNRAEVPSSSRERFV